MRKSSKGLHLIVVTGKRWREANITQRRSLSDKSVTEWSLATLHTQSWIRGLQFGGGT